MASTEIDLHPHPTSTGSALYTTSSYKLLAVANGPLEPQRRDEHPGELTLEVSVRPQKGPSGPRTISLSSHLHRALYPLINTQLHPRALLQITVQILRTPEDTTHTGPPEQGDDIVTVLPHCFTVAVLALLDSGIGMKAWGVAVGVEVRRRFGASVQDDKMDIEGEEAKRAELYMVHPSPPGSASLSHSTKSRPTSAYAFAYSSQGDLLLAYSSGTSTPEEWEKAATVAANASFGNGGLGGVVRKTIEENVTKNLRWKNTER